MLILSLLVPIFALCCLGWSLSKLSLLSSRWLSALNKLCINILIPCLLFSASYRSDLGQTFSLSLVLAFFIPVGLLFYFLYKKYSTQPEYAFCGVYSNNVFIGLPILSALLPGDNLDSALVIIALHSLIIFSLYHCTLAHLETTKSASFSVLKSLLTNPIILSLCAGSGANLLTVSLPSVLLTTIDTIASVALPCALILLGASLKKFSFTRSTYNPLVLLVKLAILPTSVWFFSAIIFQLQPNTVISFVLMAACPVGVNVFSVIASCRRDNKQAGTTILLSSVLCCFTLPLWLWLLI